MFGGLSLPENERAPRCSLVPARSLGRTRADVLHWGSRTPFV